ncbi:unnamed protein product [Scytosiphon promiscuus]
MIGRVVTTASRRAAAHQAVLGSSGRSLSVCGRASSLTTPSSCGGSGSSMSQTPAAAAGAARAGTVRPPRYAAVLVPPRARHLSSSPVPAADTSEEAPARAPGAASGGAPKLVFGIPKDNDVLRTPPMVEEDSGPVIREMRVQLRPPQEHGSRGARRVRRAGKVPGIVYSNADASLESGAPVDNDTRFLVKADKLMLDREVRRLSTSFDNTVYHLVIEGASPSDKGSMGDAGDGEGVGIATERHELVLANQTRLHPVFRTLLSVNWIRYKAGRKYPIPIKFINDDLNDNFRKGAYIRRLRTHQHILLPDDPEKVPKWLYLDLEFVRSGSKLRVSDIMMPEGIKLHRGNEAAMWNEVVCTIKGRKVFAEADSSDDDAAFDADDM